MNAIDHLFDLWMRKNHPRYNMTVGLINFFLVLCSLISVILCFFVSWWWKSLLVVVTLLIVVNIVDRVVMKVFVDQFRSGK